MINEAKGKGATLKDCCKTIEISENTIRSWMKNCEDKRPLNTGSSPSNKLTEQEYEKVKEYLFSEEFADENPYKICETLLDRGIYVCSASTMYRILKKDEASGRRTQNRKADEVRIKPCIVCTKPHEVFNWDITFLPTLCSNYYFKVLVVLDMYSKKIVGFNVIEADSQKKNLKFILKLIKDGGIKSLKILHGDNGSTVKGVRMADSLHKIGVLQSHSRPHVSNDNPYIESFFGTMKTNIKFPKEGFKTIEEATEWVALFVEKYNDTKHSGINYVTPNERHAGMEEQILQKRCNILYKAYSENPNRFPNGIRKFTIKNVITLNPMSNDEINDYIITHGLTDSNGNILQITKDIFPKKIEKKLKLA